MQTDLSKLCALFDDEDIRCHPYAQPLNATFTDVDLLLFALQIASAMKHLAQRSVRITNMFVMVQAWKSMYTL